MFTRIFMFVGLLALTSAAAVHAGDREGGIAYQREMDYRLAEADSDGRTLTSDPLPESEALEFAAPVTDGSEENYVDLPSLASGYVDPLPTSTELEFAAPAGDGILEELIDQPSLAAGRDDSLPLSEKLRLAAPATDGNDGEPYDLSVLGS